MPSHCTSASTKSHFTPDYIAYIKSDEWKAKREDAFLSHGRVCMNCGSTKYLHVHHLTYIRLFRENIADLQILCRSCHKAVHANRQIQNAIKKPKHKQPKYVKPSVKAGAKKRAANAVKTKTWFADNSVGIILILSTSNDIKADMIKAYGKNKTRRIMRSDTFKSHKKKARKDGRLPQPTPQKKSRKKKRKPL